jgi:rhamnosyltransferase
MNPKALVLLAAHNGENFLKEQIISILSQKNVDIEILINLDSSKDKSYEIIMDFQKKDKRIFFNHHVTLNSSPQNFFDLILSARVKNFDYICFSDQDDIWYEDKIISAIDKITKKNVACYSGDVISWWPKKENKYIYIKKSYKQTQFDYIFESPGPGCTFVMNTFFFKDFQNYLNTNYDNIKKIPRHDWLIYAYARVKNYLWFIDNKAYLLYRQHENNYAGANIGFLAFFKRFNDVVSEKWFREAISIQEFLPDNEIKYKIVDENSNINYLYLILNFTKFRRRTREKIAFFIFSCILYIKKKL